MSLSTSSSSRAFWLSRIFNRSKLYLSLYLLIAPTVLSLLIFSYYPKIDVVLMSFYRWQPPLIQDWVGFGNYLEAFSDPIFWQSFKLVGIILIANLIKMWPGIFAAIALHRLAHKGLRYIFQVSFVVPMIIPGMVWLLIWKSFYDPSYGLLNRLLNASGGMKVLDFLDTAMPSVANALAPVSAVAINPVFGSVAGLFIFAAFLMTAAYRKERDALRWKHYAIQVSGALLFLVAQVTHLIYVPAGLLLVCLGFVVWMFFMARTSGKAWVIWTLLTLAGVAIFWQALWRLPIAILAAQGVFELVRRRYDYFTGKPILSNIGIALIAVGCFFVFFGHIWTTPTEQFAQGTPAWLGNQDLVIPALIFWGFPWVGTVGVLIYLSGLQNISEDVYEAAELDGVGPLGMIFRIELPLIMTQVRINLIFMTIGTLTAYESFLILLGPDGGPGNVGMVPGLYMFGSAFAEGRFGYACALGMVMFTIILVLTIIYQRYVKVEK